MIFSNYLIILNNLPVIKINNQIINYRSINNFTRQEKSLNDVSNKIRELVIISIINGDIDKDYYKYSNRWRRLKIGVDNFMRLLGIGLDDDVRCLLKAGRNFNYDFQIIIDDNRRYNIEFKFNSSSITDIPQFISPMKPSKYLSKSFEEYIYENYLRRLMNEFGFGMPNKEDYLREVHSTNPRCLKNIQDKYYRGCKSSSRYSGMEDDIKFYKRANDYSKKAIEEFIRDNELDINQLSKYLMETQMKKIYMLYFNNNIYMETINEDYFTIISYEKKKNYFILETKKGIHLKVLLRWKNGNLIAFPAFQISIIGNK